MQESDSAEQLMAAFGNAGTLIQQSEFVRCRAEQSELVQADADTAYQEDAAVIADVDPDLLAAAKQVQAELHRAMHAALSSSNGFLIIPTLPGPPIHHRCLQAYAYVQQPLVCSHTVSVSPGHNCPVSALSQTNCCLYLLRRRYAIQCFFCTKHSLSCQLSQMWVCAG